MKSIPVGVSIGLIMVVALWAQDNKKPNPLEIKGVPAAVEKGAQWLVSVQGANGGWGQDGGETSYIRAGVRMESSGNDVANTAVAAMALLKAGKPYEANVERALSFILERIEASPTEGLAITDLQGTQIQRKLGPYIDTFLSSMLLAQVDGTLSKPALNARVRRALEKSVAKIEKNQKSDGSWNIAGGWAPVLGTSMASRSLYEAQQKGVQTNVEVAARAGNYTRDALTVSSASVGEVLPGTGAGFGGGVVGGVSSASVSAASAGVALYQRAQALEQLSRTEEDRFKNAKEIESIQNQLKDARFVQGFGSIGGEEFFSYLNISDGMKRTGGTAWKEWHSQITQKIVDLQNTDGTWAGHHCITGRVAVTSAAMLNLTVDRGN
jgi:hypothetical protein